MKVLFLPDIKRSKLIEHQLKKHLIIVAVYNNLAHLKAVEQFKRM